MYYAYTYPCKYIPTYILRNVFLRFLTIYLILDDFPFFFVPTRIREGNDFCEEEKKNRNRTNILDFYLCYLVDSLNFDRNDDRRCDGSRYPSPSRRYQELEGAWSMYELKSTLYATPNEVVPMQVVLTFFFFRLIHNKPKAILVEFPSSCSLCRQCKIIIYSCTRLPDRTTFFDSRFFSLLRVHYTRTNTKETTFQAAVAIKCHFLMIRFE